jgi:O-antigen/teichoic acid export membrane protein
MPAGLIRKSIFNAAAGMTMLVTGFICSIITARLLGPEANGIVAFAFWLTTTGTLIAGLGNDVLLPRMLPQLRNSGIDERRRRGFAAFITQFVLLAILIFLGAYILLTYEVRNTDWALGTESIAAITGLLFVLQAIGSVTVNFLIGEQRPDRFFRLTILASLLQLVVTVVGALNFGAAGALAGYVASYLVFFLYALRTIFVRPDSCGTGYSTLAKASLTISLGTIIESVFLNRVELAFLQQFQGIHTVGFYAVGLTLANLALQLPVQLSGTLVPYYTELAHQHGSTRLPVHLFEDVIRILAYITLPMGFGLAAISTDVVTDIFGPDFAPAGTIVALLAISAPLSVFAQISTKYIYAIGKEKARLTIGIVGAIVISVGCLAVVPFYGGEGAAVIRILMLLLISAMMIRSMEFDGSLRSMFVSLAKIGTASAICALAAYGVVEITDGLGGTLVAVVVGGGVYIVMLRLLRAVPWADAEGLAALAAPLPGRASASVGIFAQFLAGRQGRIREAG